jgi:VWFA-related protein
MKIRHPAITALAALLLLAAVPAFAQDQDAATGPLDVFGETIEVRVVNVEVVVTDRDGNRVIGLGPEDFTLVVDGDQVPIEFFSEVVGGRAVEPEVAEGAAPPPGIPAAVPGETVGTSYLLFIDDYFSIAQDRNQVLLSIADDLGFLAPDDRMAVVAFDGRQVEMLTSWTDSERVLSRVLSDAAARKASGLQRLSELRQHDRALFGARTQRSFDSIQELPIEQRVFAQQVADKVERSVGGAVAALRGFARPPGRKVMLLLSGGWPFSVAGYATGDRTIIETGDVPTGDELYRPLVDAANLLGYTLYPVDVPGLSDASGVDVERGGQLVTGLRVEPEDQFEGLSASVLNDRESNLEQSLRYVAAETGGEALINARAVNPLSTVAQDTRSYYWLGFSPQRERNDRRHDVRVRVERPGLRVRTRDTFLDLSRDAERTMAVESALLFGDPAAQGGLYIESGEPKKSGRRRIEVPVMVAIPVDFVTLLPQGDKWVAGLEMRVAALDEQDRRSDVPSVPLELRFGDKPPSGQAIPYRTNLTLRDAEQVVVVSITDVGTGKSLTGRLEVTP